MNEKKDLAIVTGAARGIGWGISQKLCEAGCRVIMIGRGENVLEKAQELKQQGYDAKGYVCDICDIQNISATIRQIVEEEGDIHILVNNAGVSRPEQFEDITEELLNFHIDTNIKGTWHMIREVIPYMRKKHYGRIINLASVTGPMVCDKGYTAYGMTKAAIVGLTKTIAVEYAEYGITCNAICPGFILTPNVESGSKRADPSDPRRVIREIESGIPMKKLGTPGQIGSAAVFLSNRDSDYITGTTLVVDGGNMLPETNAVRFEK